MAQEIALTTPERVRSLCLLATHPGIAHAVMNPEAMAMLGNRGELTAREAAEASIPFDYAGSTPRERIEEDWAVRLPLAATNQGYVAQASGTSQWDGYDRPTRMTSLTLAWHGGSTVPSRRTTAGSSLTASREPSRGPSRRRTTFSAPINRGRSPRPARSGRLDRHR